MVGFLSEIKQKHQTTQLNSTWLSWRLELGRGRYVGFIATTPLEKYCRRLAVAALPGEPRRWLMPFTMLANLCRWQVGHVYASPTCRTYPGLSGILKRPWRFRTDKGCQTVFRTIRTEKGVMLLGGLWRTWHDLCSVLVNRRATTTWSNGDPYI